MVFNRRGVSAKDLRPFSVEDPLGQGRPAPGTRFDRNVSFGSPGPQGSPHRTERQGSPHRTEGQPPPGKRPEAAAQMARVGCLLVMAVWAMGLLGSAAAWLPELLRELRPVFERVLEAWELERKGGTESSPSDPAPPPAPSDGATSGGSDAPPAGIPSTAPDPPPAAGSDPALTEVERVCARTVACCLTVQGERARSLCENFRQLPVVEPCQQAYEAFAQVGRQLDRPCQE